MARDLLQNAALFKTDKLVVWEYVSNSLDYVDPGMNPIVRVTLDSKKKRIAVADNGRGMSWSDLQNKFFMMHGENIDRKEGRPGRGRFGTGKSAAFGIAEQLRITTVRNGSRSCVELRRSSVETMASEEPIPVRCIEREVATSEPNGTSIAIEGVHLKSLDQPGIIKYIERHLARWSKNVTVFVNNHECEFTEPPVFKEERFRPEGAIKEKLGEVELIVKVSKAPLQEDLRGVSIYANGVWHETTLAGSEGREMAQCLFGEIDVPRLDEDRSPIAPFDLSRSMRLNPGNETVHAIYAFVGLKVEIVRRELVEGEKKRKATELAKKLAAQASEIARVINEDFDDFRQRVAKARAKAVGGSDVHQLDAGGGDQDDDLLFGHDLPAEVVAPNGGPGGGQEGGGQDGAPRDLAPAVTPGSPDSERKGRLAGGVDRKPSSRGGFRVEFDSLGVESHRATYVRDERTIYINLDHPQLAAARGLESVEDAAFRRLAYEVAFSEYAVALASELAARDEYLDPSDPIVDIRETLNRIARKAANLYAAG
ncbi:MAG: ATP-binding protein [Fimbriimonadales bacterium]